MVDTVFIMEDHDEREADDTAESDPVAPWDKNASVLKIIKKIELERRSRTAARSLISRPDANITIAPMWLLLLINVHKH